MTKRLKYRFQPGGLYHYIQSLQDSPHAKAPENWSGDFMSKRYAKRREGIDPIVFPQANIAA